MRSKSGKWAIALMVVLPLVVGLANGALAEENSIEVVVSPNVLNLESYGGSVSLHTDIGYDVDLDLDFTVEGEPVVSFWTKSDNRGQLVVKCSVEAVEDMAGVSEATFVLTVITPDGTEYEGSDMIRVISQSGVNRKG